jgi:cation diffusion facilitator CzcD-associated flavoprotein CzcO
MGTPLNTPIAIIGSGPSGVAARWALEELGCDFEVLDSNLREESNFFDSTNRQSPSGSS